MCINTIIQIYKCTLFRSFCKGDISMKSLFSTMQGQKQEKIVDLKSIA